MQKQVFTSGALIEVAEIFIVLRKELGVSFIMNFAIFFIFWFLVLGVNILVVLIFAVNWGILFAKGELSFVFNNIEVMYFVLCLFYRYLNEFQKFKFATAHFEINVGLQLC